MKQVAKYSFRLVLVMAGLTFFFLSGFKVREHLKGNNYINYLNANIESVPSSDELTFEFMVDDIAEARLILVGEIHGFQEPTRFDPVFFKYLRKEHQVLDYLVEMDVAQAYYLNQYNISGDEEILDRVLENWVVQIGRKNLDYKSKYKRLREVYLSEGPFMYHGNDGISDLDLFESYLQSLFGGVISSKIGVSDSVRLLGIKGQLEQVPCVDDLLVLKTYLLKNLTYAIEGRYREEVLTENLIDIYDQYELDERKVYGYYGLGHTMMAPFEGGYQAMASRFIEQRPAMRDKVISTNFIFLDSYMTNYSEQLPSFLRDEGKFTAMSVSYDNIWLSYLHGIDELKRMTSTHSVNLVKLNGTDSPYSQSRRLSSMSKILPIGMVINAQDSLCTTDYYQYLILVRNSTGAR